MYGGTYSTVTYYGSSAQNSGQSSGNVASGIQAPVQAVAARVSATGGTVPVTESSGPDVKTDGYEDYSGEWETLPGEDIRSSEAGSHGLPKAKVRILILRGVPLARTGGPLARISNKNS